MTHERGSTEAPARVLRGASRLTLRVLILVEALVIVSSILMAFSLDAWWDSKARRREAREIRAALVTEFAEARVELDHAVTRNTLIIASADTLLSVLAASDAPTATVAARQPGMLFLTPTTDPHRGALDALLASGRLEYVPSRRLRDLLAEWPSRLEDVREEEVAAKRFVHERLAVELGRAADLTGAYRWRLGLSGYNGPANAAGGREDVALERSQELANLIATRRLLAAVVLADYVELRAVFDETERLLDEWQDRRRLPFTAARAP